MSSITIPAKVGYIGREAFRDCTSLATIINHYDGYQGIQGYDGDNADHGFVNCGSAVPPGQRRAFAKTANTIFINLVKPLGYKVNYTVYFDSNGGSAVPAIENVFYNATIIPPEDPVRDGYSFDGWYKERELINKWNFDTDTVTDDIWLYTGWKSGADYVLGPAVTGAFYVDGSLVVRGSGPMYDYTAEGSPVYGIRDLIKSLIIAPGVETVGENAFYNCDKVESVTIASTVTTIKNGAFQWCDKLSSVTFESPSILTSIEGMAFFDCTALKQIAIPDSVTSIGGSAFFGSGLTSITIPSSVETIGGSAFQNCKSLTTVTFADGSTINTIANQAFRECTSLTSVNIPESVTLIDSYAFYGCTPLESISLPEMVTEIGAFAFEGCSALTSITIPARVSRIRYRAFKDCTSLATIHNNYAGNQAIEGEAFLNCGSGAEGRRAFADLANTNFMDAIEDAGYTVNYTVSFDSNDGSPVSPFRRVPPGTTIQEPAPRPSTAISFSAGTGTRNLPINGTLTPIR